MKIPPTENLIRGSWVLKDGKVTPDDSARRIESLVAEHLEEVGRDASGWSVLYRDPSDARLWLLSYPSSEEHGGGPPQLQHVDSGFRFS
jgi:hypothetical protein